MSSAVIAGPSTVDPGFRKWIVALRPWGIPISAVPTLMGSALAWVYGEAEFRWGVFLFTFLGAQCLHAAANMISDVHDFRRGLDRVVLPVSGALARGWLTERQTLAYAMALVVAGSLMGLWVAIRSGPVAIWAGAVGVALLLAYSWLKRIALGDAAVFIAFGPLIALGSWATQAGTFSWLPVVWMVPFAMMVIAVLHANNWRDMESDAKAGITSVARLLGDGGSLAYYGFLIFGPFALLLALMVVPRLGGRGWIPLPWTFLLAFLSLPATLRLWGRARRRRAPRDPLEFTTLDGATAQSMVPFGALSTLAIILARWVGQ